MITRTHTTLFYRTPGEEMSGRLGDMALFSLHKTFKL